MTVELAGEATVRSLGQQVAAEVRAALARRSITGSELARRVNEKQGWVSRRLTGEVAMSMDDLERFARAIGIAIEVLISAPTTLPPQREPFARPAGIEPATNCLEGPSINPQAELVAA